MSDTSFWSEAATKPFMLYFVGTLHADFFCNLRLLDYMYTSAACTPAFQRMKSGLTQKPVKILGHAP